MRIQDIFREIMQREGISQGERARQLGVSRQAVSAMMHNKDIKLFTVLSVLDVMGYDFKIIKSKRTIIR